MVQDHRLHGFNYNVEEWDERDHYETLAEMGRSALARVRERAASMSTWWRPKALFAAGSGSAS